MPGHKTTIDGWSDDLHEREWMWWSSAIIDGGIKIDLETGGLPTSTYCLREVIQRAGGEVVFDDLWIDTQAALKYLDK